MKRFLAILLGLIMIISLTACGSKGGNNSPSSSVTPPEESEVNIDDTFTRTNKTLVVYFSKTNTTESVAKLIQSETGADIFEIERKEPYPDAYTPTTEVAKDEKDANARPELKTYLPKDVIAGYDTIFVGFPIWWGTAPMPVLSFLNFYDFSGKTIYTFCTAASSSISGSTADIRSNASGANVVEGKRFSRNDESGVKSWIASLNLNNPDTPDVPDPTPTPDPAPQENKILVVYFSGSGNTERVAGYIAEATGGTLFELVPVTPYTSADLNWTNSNSRVVREHEDETLRDIPLEKVTPDNFTEYDVVFIGYPIWWGIAAWPVNNFVKNNDFTGKTVIPFCTSASSGLGQSGTLLAEMAGTGNWLTGNRFSSGASKSTVETWVNGLNLAA